MMKKLSVLLIVGLFIAGCAKDIVVEPPGDLAGIYSGKYEIIWNYQGSNAKTEKMNIDWTFSDYKFWLRVPEGEDTTAITNNLSGDYSLGEDMVFSNVVKEPGSFKPESVPEGEFVFTRVTGVGDADTLKMIQIGGPAMGLIRKSIIIVKIQ